MNYDPFEEILASVKSSATLSTPQKKDLDELLNALAGEMLLVAVEDPEAYRSALNFLICALFESTRRERVSVIAMAARKGMLLSFRPFDEKYPKLTAVAYNLGDRLSSLGV